MRTTLAIDDDILAAAKHLAARDNRTVGTVLSELARSGLAKSSRSKRTTRNGIPLLANSKVTVTPELVNTLLDESL